MLTWDDITAQAKRQAYKYVPEYDPAVDLDDLVQEIMLLVWKHEHNINGTEYPPDYVAKIIRNACINYLRKIRYASHPNNSGGQDRVNTILPMSVEHYRESEGIEDSGGFADNKPSIERILMGKERLIAVLRVVTPQQARVLFPHIQGYSNEEIAHAFGITKAGVMASNQKAMKSIDKHINDPNLDISSDNICATCGGFTYTSKCKVVCSRCGRYRDCSDP